MEKKVCAGEREGQRKKEKKRVCTFVPFTRAAGLTVAEDDDGEEGSTMRHRYNKRGENLDSSHSVAPASTEGRKTPANFDLRHSDPDDWIPPSRGSGQLFAPH